MVITPRHFLLAMALDITIDMYCTYMHTIFLCVCVRGGGGGGGGGGQSNPPLLTMVP